MAVAEPDAPRGRLHGRLGSGGEPPNKLMRLYLAPRDADHKDRRHGRRRGWGLGRDHGLQGALGTACASGTALHTGTFNANGTGATNQTLTLSATIADLQLAAGDRVSFGTADGAAFIAGSGNGAITVSARAL